MQSMSHTYSVSTDLRDWKREAFYTLHHHLKRKTLQAGFAASYLNKAIVVAQVELVSYCILTEYYTKSSQFLGNALYWHYYIKLANFNGNIINEKQKSLGIAKYAGNKIS